MNQEEEADNGLEALTAAYTERTAEILKENRPNSDRLAEDGDPDSEIRIEMDSEDYGRAVAIDQVAADIALMFSEDVDERAAFVRSTFTRSDGTNE